MRIRSDIRLLVEAFAVLTGVSFVLSALAQALIFLSWGMDFFMLASVDDIIEGGLRLMATFAIFMAAAMPLFAIQAAFFVSKLSRRQRIIANIGAIIAVLIFADSIVLAYMIKTYFFEYFIERGYHFSVFLILCIAALLISCVRWLTSPFTISQVMDEFVRSWKRSTIFSALASIIILSSFTVKSYSSVSVVDDSIFPPECRSKNYGYYSIMWVGTRGMVLRCRFGMVAVLLPQQAIAFRIGPHQN